MDSGENIFVDRSEQEDEQRLREVMCERRVVSICCHDSPHDEAVDPPVRPFHTVSEGELCEVRVATALHVFTYLLPGVCARLTQRNGGGCSLSVDLGVLRSFSQRASGVRGLEAVMNSIRKSLGMRETEIAREPSRLWNP